MLSIISLIVVLLSSALNFTGILCIYMFQVLLLALLVSVAAFRPYTRPAVSTKRFLFGAPEPKKDELKKDGGGGMFGGMGNIMDQMKKAQEIAKKAEVVNRELMNTVIQGQDPAGLCVATYNGLGTPISMRITEAGIAQGAEALSLAASQAMVDGYAKAQSSMMTKMQAMYADSGINMPLK